MFKTSAHRSMDMTEGPLFTKVLFFALPIMLSGILQLLFNAADTIVVGRFAGSQALAAVGSVGSLNNMIISLFVGLSIGANVLVARYTGARDNAAVSETVHTSVLLSLIGGSLLAVIGVALARPLLSLMGSPDDVIDLAVLYVRILFLGMPVQMLYNYCAAVLRAVGDTKRPLYFLTAAGVVNVILNLIFVVYFHMSVAGVALATIISQAISAWLVTHSLMTTHGPTQLRLRRLHINKKILMEIIRIGLPAGIQSSVFSLSNVVIQSSVNSFGSIAIAGNAAAANVGSFVYQAMNTFHQAITCFSGQNIGARKPMRIIDSIKACMFWALLFGTAFGWGSCLFGETLLGFYSADPAVIAVGMERLFIVNGPYFICGAMDVMTGALRGIGYSMLPMLVSILGACAFRILWVMTIFAANPTIPSLMFSYPVSWALTFAVLLFFFRLIWKRRFLLEFTPEELARR
ncbi:MAG: MATE family efflux transporter [Clostridia bacterium]|nr:MATE family efflux transporter [Clostridia bacterium]